MVASLRQSAGGARTRAMLAAYICFAAYAAAGVSLPRLPQVVVTLSRP
jgi:hypothetical protein